MSRTTRHIPYWINEMRERYPESYNDPRSEYYNGYDDHSKSWLKVSIAGWPEDFRSSATRKCFKRKMNKYWRKSGLKEIARQLFIDN